MALSRLPLIVLLLVLLGCIQNPSDSLIEGRLNLPNVSSQYINETMNETIEINETEIPETNITTNTSSNATVDQPPEEDEPDELEGLLFGDGEYILVLDDLVLDETKPGGVCAAVSIVEVETLARLDRKKICKEVDKTWTAPDGHVYRIHLVEAIAGYTGESKWAEFRITG